MAGVVRSRYAVGVPVMADVFQRGLPHPRHKGNARTPSTSRSKVLADHAVDEIRFRADPWEQNDTAMPSKRDCGGAPKTRCIATGSLGVSPPNPELIDRAGELAAVARPYTSNRYDGAADLAVGVLP
jgi:hypothetical protein